jgi:catechol-2,3-dioxygenase
MRVSMLAGLGLAMVIGGSALAQPPAETTAPQPDPNAPTKPLPANLKPNRIRASGINVTDLERERAYYVNVLGMHEIRRPNANEIVLGYGAGDQAALVLNKAAKREGQTSYGRLILDVANPEALAEHLKSLGYAVRKVGRPTDRAFFTQDPEGYSVEIYTPNAP